MTKIITNLFFLLALLYFFTHCSSASGIYGVRWFLGQTSRFHVAEPKQQQGVDCDLMLIFNSQQEEVGQTTVQVQGIEYVCYRNMVLSNLTQYHHNKFNQLASNRGDIFQTYIYKCPIKFDKQDTLGKQSQFNYKISTQQKLLFQATLRSPFYYQDQTQVLVIGDWGLITNFSTIYYQTQSINHCLRRTVKQRKDIRLMLMLGDLGYDLQGKTYIRFLTQLQQFSSELVMQFTSGNHQTLHYDLYQLVKQSFWSPFWGRFHGYYDLTAIGKYAFLGYNPESVFTWLRNSKSKISMYQWSTLQKQYGDYYYLFQKQLTTQTKQVLKEDYTVIAYSHYPIYASEDDEHQRGYKYRKLQSPYLQVLKEVGMQIYFSGHLHYYERSKMICTDGSMFEQLNGMFDGKKAGGKEGCSVYVIQGAAGNNYFLQTKQHFPLKQFAQKLVQKTGFGVLTLPHHQQQQSKGEFLYEHLSTAINCSAADQFTLSSLNKSKKKSSKSFTDRWSFSDGWQLDWYVVRWLLWSIAALALIALVIASIRLFKEKRTRVPISRSHDQIESATAVQSAQSGSLSDRRVQ